MLRVTMDNLSVSEVPSTSTIIHSDHFNDPNWNPYDDPPRGDDESLKFDQRSDEKDNVSVNLSIVSSTDKEFECVWSAPVIPAPSNPTVL